MTHLLPATILSRTILGASLILGYVVVKKAIDLKTQQVTQKSFPVLEKAVKSPLLAKVLIVGKGDGTEMIPTLITTDMVALKTPPPNYLPVQGLIQHSNTKVKNGMFFDVL